MRSRAPGRCAPRIHTKAQVPEVLLPRTRKARTVSVPSGRNAAAARSSPFEDKAVKWSSSTRRWPPSPWWQRHSARRWYRRDRGEHGRAEGVHGAHGNGCGATTGHLGVRFVSISAEHKSELQVWLSQKLEQILPEFVADQFRKVERTSK